MIRNAALILVPCAVLIAAGCSKPSGEVEGTVTLDGQPAANIVVTFIPDYDAGAKDGLPATAVTDENGRYKLRSTSDAQQGVFVGKHVVVCETPRPC
jgi:5-hydroxyisourate hydrolase-like protein (transthyretin family)